MVRCSKGGGTGGARGAITPPKIVLWGSALRTMCYLRQCANPSAPPISYCFLRHWPRPALTWESQAQFSETGCVMPSTALFNLRKYHHALSRVLSSLVLREKDVTLCSEKLPWHYPHLSDFKNTRNHHSWSISTNLWEWLSHPHSNSIQKNRFQAMILYSLAKNLQIQLRKAGVAGQASLDEPLP